MDPMGLGWFDPSPICLIDPSTSSKSSSKSRLLSREIGVFEDEDWLWYCLSLEGNRGYRIPRGFLFNIVTCANYTTQIYQWVGFNIATQTIVGYVFIVFGALFMTNWALAKHRRLQKLFDGKEGRAEYPRRWVILPPFL